MCAGEHLSDDVLAGWRERFGQDIYEAIGMSECSYYMSQRKGVPIRPGSVGMPQPGHVVKLLDADLGFDTSLLNLHEVPVGEEGMIAIAEDDPGLFLRYWNQPEETARLRRGRLVPDRRLCPPRCRRLFLVSGPPGRHHQELWLSRLPVRGRAYPQRSPGRSRLCGDRRGGGAGQDHHCGVCSAGAG